MTTPHQPKRVQQAPTMDEVQNIIKLQRSIVMADLLKVAPELSNTATYDEALKKATRQALNVIYHAKHSKVITEAYVGWYISCVLWKNFHKEEKDYKKCPIFHLKPIDFPGEPESTAWNYYMMGREEAAKDKHGEKGDSGSDHFIDQPVVGVPAKAGTASSNADTPITNITVKSNTSYMVMVEMKGDREEAYPLFRYLQRCVRQFPLGKDYVLQLIRGPNHKSVANKSEANKPAEQDSRPAKRPRH